MIFFGLLMMRKGTFAFEVTTLAAAGKIRSLG